MTGNGQTIETIKIETGFIFIFQVDTQGFINKFWLINSTAGPESLEDYFQKKVHFADLLLFFDPKVHLLENSLLKILAHSCKVSKNCHYISYP